MNKQLLKAKAKLGYVRRGNRCVQAKTTGFSTVDRLPSYLAPTPVANVEITEVSPDSPNDFSQ